MSDGWGGGRVCGGDQGLLAAGGVWENEGRLEEQGSQGKQALTAARWPRPAVRHRSGMAQQGAMHTPLAL